MVNEKPFCEFSYRCDKEIVQGVINFIVPDGNGIRAVIAQEIFDFLIYNFNDYHIYGYVLKGYLVEVSIEGDLESLNMMDFIFEGIKLIYDEYGAR